MITNVPKLGKRGKGDNLNLCLCLPVEVLLVHLVCSSKPWRKACSKVSNRHTDLHPLHHYHRKKLHGKLHREGQHKLKEDLQAQYRDHFLLKELKADLLKKVLPHTTGLRQPLAASIAAARPLSSGRQVVKGHPLLHIQAARSSSTAL